MTHSFRTKAESLDDLTGRLTSAVILPRHHFTVPRWNDDPAGRASYDARPGEFGLA
jgi:hypothetical protein